jgi:tetratricopeptide (TPR) repeat protein
MRRKLAVIGPFLAFLVMAVPLGALYVMPEIRQVPVDRLAANLERDAEADPKNIEKVINLARVYAMAYALKSTDVPTTAGPDKVDRPYFGAEDPRIPRDIAKASSRAQEAAAQQQLKKAIAHYESALALDPQNLTARLGYAWSLEQSGRKAPAIEAYRLVVSQAWAKGEQKAAMGRLGKRFFTEEAAGYLIPLLDSTKDAAEIADLEAKRTKLQQMPRPITPIAVPLSDDLPAHRILDPIARVRFDADGSGLRREWTWITPDAGWLVYDARDRGSITSALQLFGSVTFWLFWSNGYEALRALDDNGDGELAGRELQHLAIWQDRNRDGISDPGEVRPLAEYNIVALSCSFVQGDGVRISASSPAGVRFADGHTRATHDVLLHPSSSILTRRQPDRDALFNDGTHQHQQREKRPPDPGGRER